MGSKPTERELYSLVYSMLMQNIIVGTDPSKIYQLTSDWMKSYGLEDKIKPYLGPAPTADDIDTPEDENTLMIQGDFKRVVPQITENHIQHIMEHSKLMESPNFQQMAQTAPALGQEIMTYNQQHIQQHMMMMQQLQQMMQQAQKGAQKGQGGESGAFGGNPNADQNASSQQGVGNSQGPMGEALNTQREGKVQQPKGA